jgi:hypothetical protein
MGTVLPVSYPPDTFDCAETERELGFEGARAIGATVEGLERLERSRKPTVVFYSGSHDYETLLCPEGYFRIVNYRWWRGTQQQHAAVLAERYPRLRDYLSTRTKQFIAYERDELEFVGSQANRDFIGEHLAVLEAELEELDRPSDID